MLTLSCFLGVLFCMPYCPGNTGQVLGCSASLRKLCLVFWSGGSVLLARMCMHECSPADQVSYWCCTCGLIHSYQYCPLIPTDLRNTKVPNLREQPTSWWVRWSPVKSKGAPSDSEWPMLPIWFSSREQHLTSWWAGWQPGTGSSGLTYCYVTLSCWYASC